MAEFVRQIGGTDWAGVQTQYYQTNPAGTNRSITNPANQLAGIWVDDTNNASGLANTSSSNPPGAGNTYTDRAREAARAVAHFKITDLADTTATSAPGSGIT